MTGVCDVDSRVSALPTRKQEAAFEKMIDLQQTGPVIEYIERFDYLSELVHPVFQKEERLIPFFLRGLHRSIQMTVRLQKPVDIADCYRQAQWAASVMEPEYRRMEHNSRQQRARRQGQASHVAVKSRGAQASRVAPESRGDHYEDKVGLYTMTVRPHYEDKVGLYTMTTRPNKCANRRTSAEKRKDCYLCGEVGHFKRNCPHAGGTKARRP